MTNGLKLKGREIAMADTRSWPHPNRVAFNVTFQCFRLLVSSKGERNWTSVTVILDLLTPQLAVVSNYGIHPKKSFAVTATRRMFGYIY